MKIQLCLIRAIAIGTIVWFGQVQALSVPVTQLPGQSPQNTQQKLNPNYYHAKHYKNYPKECKSILGAHVVCAKGTIQLNPNNSCQCCKLPPEPRAPHRCGGV